MALWIEGAQVESTRDGHATQYIQVLGVEDQQVALAGALDRQVQGAQARIHPQGTKDRLQAGAVFAPVFQQAGRTVGHVDARDIRPAAVRIQIDIDGAPLTIAQRLFIGPRFVHVEGIAVVGARYAVVDDGVQAPAARVHHRVDGRRVGREARRLR